MISTKRWSGAFDAIEAINKESTKGKLTEDEIARRRYLVSLQSDAPVAWESDHLAESKRLRGAVYVAIKVLGDQAAAAEVKISKWHPDARMAGDDDAKEPLERDHPLARLLLRPNRHESGGYLRQRRVQQLALTGTSLLWRVDDGMQTPTDLWSIPTGTYQPVPMSERWPDGAYRVMPFFPGPLAMIPSNYSQGGVIVPAERMIACRHPHPLIQGAGLSPLTACDLPMDTIEAIDRGRYSKARQGANPSAVAEMDPAVAWPTPDQLIRLRKEVQQAVGGPDKAGGIALMGPGITLEPWTEGNIEVGWIESWNQLVGFVMAVIGIAKGMAFLDEGDASYAKLYAMLKQFNLFSMCPLLRMLADADNMQLAWPFFGEEYHIEYVPQRVDDDTILEQQHGTLLKCGGATINEIRKRYSLPPVAFGEERATASYKDPSQVKAEAEAKASAQPAGVGANGKPQDPAEKDRPRNDQGQGSLPPLVSGANLRGFNAPNPNRNGKHRFNGRH